MNSVKQSIVVKQKSNLSIVVKERLNLMTKSALLLAVFSLAVASAANVNLNLIQPTTVNGTQFKPGEAKLEIKDNNTAVLKQGKVSAEVPIKVEANDNKYVFTSVGYKEGSDHEIKEIFVGGTTKHIVFETPSSAGTPAGGQK